jgi:hypothetical protein
MTTTAQDNIDVSRKEKKKESPAKETNTIFFEKVKIIKAGLVLQKFFLN